MFDQPRSQQNFRPKECPEKALLVWKEPRLGSITFTSNPDCAGLRLGDTNGGYRMIATLLGDYESTQAFSYPADSHTITLVYHHRFFLWWFLSARCGGSSDCTKAQLSLHHTRCIWTLNRSHCRRHLHIHIDTTVASIICFALDYANLHRSAFVASIRIPLSTTPSSSQSSVSGCGNDSTVSIDRSVGRHLGLSNAASQHMYQTAATSHARNIVSYTLSD